MKNIYYYIGLTLLMAITAFGLGSCSSEDFTSPSESGIPKAVDYKDAIRVDIDQSTNYVTFSFKAKQVMPIWIIDGKTYSSMFSLRRYYRKAGNYSIDVKIANANGISDAAITKTFHIEKTIMNGFGGFVYDSDFNLWRKAVVNKPTFWYAPGWVQIADPAYVMDNASYVVSLPEATKETWQAQMLLRTNMSSSAANKYDFSVILTSTTDHPHVMVKLVDNTDDNIFYFAEPVKLSANEPLCYWKNDMKGLDIANLKLVIDFGGNTANTDVTIENVVFKDHADNDGTKVPDEVIVPDPNWAGVKSSDNIWYGMKFNNTFYYAPGWTLLPNPQLTVNDTEYSLDFPKATAGQWQNQVTFVTESLSTVSTEKYDFRVTLKSTNDIKGVTIKLAQENDDNVFLFLKRVDLVAGGDLVVKVISTDGVNISKGKLIFDFGGNPDNTNVSIKDIILQKHKD